ncbi:MAG: hypothetical protein GVY11_07360, partial [Gammaproteobacteria bacterium]|nr:hypothetical protein [Gammaproteobacteria bacterium]
AAPGEDSIDSGVGGDGGDDLASGAGAVYGFRVDAPADRIFTDRFEN